VSEPGSVLLGRAELERAFTALGDRLVRRASWRTSLSWAAAIRHCGLARLPCQRGSAVSGRGYHGPFGLIYLNYRTDRGACYGRNVKMAPTEA
jgi:hypothetical protein